MIKLHYKGRDGSAWVTCLAFQDSVNLGELSDGDYNLTPREFILKPCPCCGGTAEFVSYTPTRRAEDGHDIDVGWFIRCMQCEMLRTTKSDVGCSKQSAAICWNRRKEEE